MAHTHTYQNAHTLFSVWYIFTHFIIYGICCCVVCVWVFLFSSSLRIRSLCKMKTARGNPNCAMEKQKGTVFVSIKEDYGRNVWPQFRLTVLTVACREMMRQYCASFGSGFFKEFLWVKSLPFLWKFDFCRKERIRQNCLLPFAFFHESFLHFPISSMS